MDWYKVIGVIILTVAQAACWYAAGYNRGAANAVARMVDALTEMLEKV